jgi:murein L,D-transpeptidase YafK
MHKSRIVKICLLVIVLFFIAYYFSPYAKIPEGIIIDKIVVIKSKHILLAYSKTNLIKTYTISLGKQSRGNKEFEGDNKTPEGIYIINSKNPNSSFNKNLGISYPNEIDISRSKNLGKLPGGEIKIHGLRSEFEFLGRFQRWVDWTNGCIALTNQEIDDLYKHTPIGIKIVIMP